MNAVTEALAMLDAISDRADVRAWVRGYDDAEHEALELRLDVGEARAVLDKHAIISGLTR